MSKKKKTAPAGPVYRPRGPELGVHDWVYREADGLVCAYCGESEVTAMSAGCPVAAIRDRDGQVFLVRALEPEPEPDRLAEIVGLD